MNPNSTIKVGAVEIGNSRKLALIAGPCQMESRAHALEMASALKQIAAKAGVGLIYKTSFDKANRTSGAGKRGAGLRASLPIFAEIRESLGVPVLTDVHEREHCAAVAEAVDVLQIPAFLCRQTDLLVAAAQTSKVVNVKKGQFLAPWDMKNVIEKVTGAGNPNVLVTERGTSFGYNNLVVDYRGLAIMRELGYPVVFDATHSVQLPGGLGTRSGGERQYVPLLARAAVAVGVDALFMEMHEEPDRTLPDGRPLSDGPNMLRLDDLPRLLGELQSITAGLGGRGGSP
jgi:2-dehydro-3-deoxyphosphooctonate aldolase (KDO 8-P synthase)